MLADVLAYMSKRGSSARNGAVALVDALRADPQFRIVRQTPRLFDDGLDLYRARADKGYSLTDCMSLVICHRQHIREVLTHDHHFGQEGFVTLL